VKKDIWKSETTEIETEVGSMYITVNLNDMNVPVKMIIHSSKSGSKTAHFTDAIGRVITTALEHGVLIKYLVRDLREVGGNFDPPTIPDAIAIVLDTYVKRSSKAKASDEAVRKIAGEGKGGKV
jgi:ribonucleoside-diphosphate reductase alpha chain